MTEHRGRAVQGVDTVSDYITLTLSVRSWLQALNHGGQSPPRQLRCIARTSGQEELQLTGGPSIRTLDFYLLISRGEYVPAEGEHALASGIGILAFAEERQPEGDIPGSEPFCHGWWWMPEALYDETWDQVRGHTWQDCSIEIDIAPIEHGNQVFHWDVTKQRATYVTRASLRFIRRNPERPLAAPPPSEPRKRRGLFG
jgi:hypothetical protein